MVSLEKRKFLTPLQKLLKNVGELGKLIVAKGFEKLPKIQKIAKSGHTAQRVLDASPSSSTLSAGIFNDKMTYTTPKLLFINFSDYKFLPNVHIMDLFLVEVSGYKFCE